MMSFVMRCRMVSIALRGTLVCHLYLAAVWRPVRSIVHNCVPSMVLWIEPLIRGRMFARTRHRIRILSMWDLRGRQRLLSDLLALSV